MEISQLHHDIGNKITDFQNTKPNHLSHRCNNRENKDYHEDYKKIDDYNKRDTRSTQTNNMQMETCNDETFNNDAKEGKCERNPGSKVLNHNEDKKAKE